MLFQQFEISLQTEQPVFFANACRPRPITYTLARGDDFSVVDRQSRAMNTCGCRGAGCSRCAPHTWDAARNAPPQAFETVQFSTTELLKPTGSRVVFPKGFGAPVDARPDGSNPSMAPPSYAAMDERTRGTWEYPSSEDYPDREYQLEIASVALFQNTLVALPTGLGKTFIAAVVMYNYYRWGPPARCKTGANPFSPAPHPPSSAQLVSHWPGRFSRPDAPPRYAADRGVLQGCRHPRAGDRADVWGRRHGQAHVVVGAAARVLLYAADVWQ